MSLLIGARRGALPPPGNDGISGLRTLAGAASRAAPLLAIGIGLGIVFSLAALRVVITDPFAALHIFGVLLLLGVVASVYAVAAAIFTNRTTSILAIVLAFLVTDRFLELFAFGGLLQAGALMFMTLSVAAFVRAGAGPGVQRIWWSLGSVSLVLAALSHVGTGVLAVP